MLRYFLRIAITGLCFATASTWADSSGLVLLYDQSVVPSQTSGGAYPTQHASTYSVQLADDFIVGDDAGWTINEFTFAIDFTDPNGTDPGQPPYDIYVYPDAAGVPAVSASCQYPAMPGTLDPTLPGGEMNVTVPLAPACFLPPGHYWVQVSPVLDVPYSLWGYNATDSAVLHEPVFRNPDNSYDTGCTDWTVTSACLPNPFGGVPNFQFQVLGSIGAGDSIFADGFDG
jgi:hypothetical protein